MPTVAKGKKALPLALEEYQIEYLEHLAALKTNMGTSKTAIAEFLLRREIQRLIDTEHHNKDWR